jgi:hypothetical protein
MSPNIKNHFMVVRRGHSRSIAHHRSAWLVPIRITLDVGTTLAAGRANEPVLAPIIARSGDQVNQLQLGAATLLSGSRGDLGHFAGP